ncbi:MAG TPA: pyruvate dehydrogenase (acetyl-transferring), homodimeric type, partial [Moraxellaceae bacterium]|nr:pyruvate dehydrogenase (acetyl-transferring), homodimeric type [Moraxellaceae bacterium]
GTGAGEGVNKTHQLKKLDLASLKGFRDRFDMPFTDEELAKVPFYRPPEQSPELRYLHERRERLGGYLPVRNNRHTPVPVPALDAFASVLQGSERPISTTMAFVRLLNLLVKMPDLGERVVPIVPDEARTFGMEGMFRQLGIYSHVGQLYTPEDAEQMMYYKEDKKGRILEEGINEAGAMSAWIAAGTAYSMHGYPLVPFYIFYSMFGFQRIGDLAWAAGDIQAQGFLLGATSGRTTLNGEGLQHQDGHSLLLASTIPNCVAYDPCYAHELAVILQDGLKRMYGDGERVFYYLTTMNENYPHPAMPAGAEEGIRRGLYLLRPATEGHSHEVQLLGSGTILREVEAAAELLFNVYGIRAHVWSVTSFNELRKEALACEHWNHLHPLEEPRVPWVMEQLRSVKGAIVAASDYMRIVAEQIRAFLPQGLPYITLGTDGFGRSDSREQLRAHFQVDRYFIAIAALNALADDGVIGRSMVQDAIERFGIDADKPFAPLV